MIVVECVSRSEHPFPILLKFSLSFEWLGVGYSSNYTAPLYHEEYVSLKEWFLRCLSTRLTACLSFFEPKELSRIIEVSAYVETSYEFASGFERKTLVLIFLLINHLSHDTHFFTRQNMETFQWPQKNSNFSLYRFSWYLIFDPKHGLPGLNSFFYGFVFVLPKHRCALSIT